MRHDMQADIDAARYGMACHSSQPMPLVGSCTGACDQGRRPCAHPEQCVTSRRWPWGELSLPGKLTEAEIDAQIASKQPTWWQRLRAWMLA